ncbi:Hypothetical predicted protein [Pelobates cultripes]|uniref:Uncharacterized protein n=1 Tax=Pelobates cultripes TaxID=61616 RepID=A0AAD1SFI9_PELCU|nr:Hypothetical predicted protein [Pelobates cultripes]
MKQFDADINLVRTEIQAVTAQVQASEEDILDLRQEVKRKEDTLRHLQSANTVFQNTQDAMEDCSRRTDIIIREIPDIGPTKLSQFRRRLTAVLLPHTHAKKLEFDGHFRINKAKRAPTMALRDFLVRCHSTSNKRSIMAAVGGEAPVRL